MDITTILQQIPDGIGRLWILGLLPCVPFLYMIAGTMAIWFRGDAQAAREVRAWKRDSKTEYFFHTWNRMKKVYQKITLVLVTVVVVLVLNYFYDQTYENILANASDICDRVIGITTIAVTVSAVVILFNKKYYLVFSIQEVLQAYHFSGSVGCIFASCLTMCFATFMLLSYTPGVWMKRALVLTLECSMLYNFIADVFCFRTNYKVMFSSQKIELRLLNHLDRIFWTADGLDDSDVRGAKEWSFSAMRPNVEYLCGRYVAQARKLPIQDVKELHAMVHGRSNTSVWDKYAKKLRNYFVIWDVIFYIVSVMISIVALNDGSLGLILLDTFFLVISFIFALYQKSPVYKAFTNFIHEMMGCCMDTRHGGQVLIPRYSMIKKNKYAEFINRMNNLTAFFVIALRQGVDQKAIESAVLEALDWLSDIGEKDRNIVLYLPIFSIGYFAYEKGMYFSELQSLFQKWKMEDTLTLFQTMIEEQIFYLTQASYQKEDYRKETEKYLAWLDGRG